MSLPPRQRDEHQQRAFLRQAEILRRNLIAWDATLRSSGGEDWPSMLGRLNAAYNQARNLDRIGIDDASEHLVYVPRRCLANAQDVALFLSTRLEQDTSSSTSGMGGGGGGGGGENEGGKVGDEGRGDVMRGRRGLPNNEGVKLDHGGVSIGGDHNNRDYGGEEPATRLRRYENRIAELASEFEDGMVRF
ncbi:hypothetical protein ACHAXA_004557 [Cyclostephanos tholiformis]|uniref:Uncharacterized protein n=1 Tax=Cyclostephanos tholiformis TaxID=382380 RepID=A0ABD3RKI3_9STRA